jgi:nicotinate-nucleotide adenylyltransferase
MSKSMRTSPDLVPRLDASEPAPCLFGGTFDPVHLGHLAIAQAAHDQGGFSPLVFLPARRSPHKHGTEPAPAPDRLAMLHLAVDPLGWAAISGWDLDRPGPNYSWQAVDHFSELWDHPARIGWILGADQWQAIESWARPDRLAQRLTFLVFPRDGIPIQARPGFSHTVIQVSHPASSTAVRDAVRNGGSLERLVPRSVAEYIAEHRLYREPSRPARRG